MCAIYRSQGKTMTYHWGMPINLFQVAEYSKVVLTLVLRYFMLTFGWVHISILRFMSKELVIHSFNIHTKFNKLQQVLTDFCIFCFSNIKWYYLFFCYKKPTSTMITYYLFSSKYNLSVKLFFFVCSSSSW